MTKVNHGDDLQRLAGLLRARNANEAEITQVIGRPAQLGHIGEYIAGQIFDVALEQSDGAVELEWLRDSCRQR